MGKFNMTILSLFVFLFKCSAASDITGLLDEGLDPKQITWWQETWTASGITLSSSNAGTVSLYFHVRLSTALSSGVVEIGFPSGVSHNSLLFDTYTFTSQTLAASSDLTLEIPDVVTTPGVFGPFSIRTRNVLDGQVLDMNLLFGSISIVSAVTPTSSLEISGSTTTAEIESTTILSFSFSLTVDLWKYDILELEISSYYTPASLVSCASNVQYSLACTTSGQKIVVYGLTSDQPQGTQMELDVSFFTLPSYVYTSGYSWALRAFRFATDTLLMHMTSAAAPITLEPGVISVKSWESTSEFDPLKVTSGLELFTELTFAAPHSIPASGVVDVTFSGVDISSGVWYYGDSDGSGPVTAQCAVEPTGTCTVLSATQLQITFSSALSAGEIKVLTLTQFGTQPKVASIVSQTSVAEFIDQLDTEFVSFALRTGWSTLTSFDAQADLDDTLDAATGRWYGGTSTGRHIFFVYDHATSWSSSTLELRCPFTDLAISFTEMYLDITAVWKENSAAGTSTDHSAVTAAPASLVYSNTDQKFDITPLDSLNSEQYSLSVSGTVALPLVESNLGTFYECWTIVTTGSVAEVGAARFTVRAVQLANFNVSPICLGSLQGLPLVFEMTIEQLTLNLSTFGFEIEVTVQADLALGVSSVPIQSSDSDVAATFSYDGSSHFVLSGFGSKLNVGDVLRAYLPSGVALGAGVGNSAELRYSSGVYSQSNVLFTGTGSFSTAATASLTMTPTGTALNPSEITDLAFGMTGSVDVNYNYVGITSQLDFSSAVLSYSDQTPIETILLTSDDPAFTGNVIIARESVSFQIGDGVSHSILLENIKSSSAVDTLSFYAFEAPQFYSGGSAAGYPTRGSCLSLSSAAATYNVVSQAMAAPAVSVSSCEIRGPGNYDTEISVIMTIAYPIPIGGEIKITLSNAWSITHAHCSTTVGSCSLAGLLVTVVCTSEVSAAAQVIVYIQGLLPPSAGSVGSSIGLISNLQTEYNSALIEQTAVSSTCVLATKSNPGTSSITANTYPNGAGLTGVSVHFTLSFSKNLPVDSRILFKVGFASWGVSSDFCWSSLLFSSCRFLNNDIELVLAEAYTAGNTLDVLFDSVLTLPSTAGVHTNAFAVESYWHSVLVTQDTAYTSFTVNPGPTGYFIESSVDASNYNEGEYANYTIKFKSSINMYPENEIWMVFSKNYNPYLGDAYYELSECQERRHIMQCSSVQFPGIVCYADHWMLKMINLNTVVPGSEVAIYVENVQNPTTSANFKLYVIDEDVVGVGSANFDWLTFTGVPQLLNLRSVETTSSSMDAVTDLTFHFHLSATLTNEFSIVINFPREYEFQKYSTSSVACTSVYVSNDVQYTYSNTTSCQLHGKVATYNLSTQHNFSEEDEILVTLLRVQNPRWGLPRTATNYLFDTIDSSIFDLHEIWTSRFEVSIYSSAAHSVAYKSYSQLNSAYLGFSSEFQGSLDINNYNPLAKTNRIIALAGTQTVPINVTINDWLLSSEKLRLTPTLQLDEAVVNSWTHNFTFFQWTDYIYFRVAVPQDAVPGLYFIEWSLDETLEDGDTTKQYRPPYSTLIEVCNEYPKMHFTIGAIPDLYKGYTSIPVSVGVSLPPSSEVTLNVKFDQNSADLYVSPSSLAFERDVSERFFQVVVSSNFTSLTNPTLIFTIEGVNAESYETPSSIAVVVYDSLLVEDPPKLALSVYEKLQNSATITVSSESGVLHWWLACKGAKLPTFEELSAMTSSVVEEDGKLSIDEQVRNDYLETEVNGEINDTAYEFIRKQYADHCTKRWVNRDSVSPGSEKLTFDWLYAETSYSIVGYLESPFFNETPSMINVNFTTTDMPSIYYLTLTFEADLDVSQEKEIRLVVADWLQVNPLWLDAPIFTQTTIETSDRRLNTVVDTSTFAWNILYDRKRADYDSARIASQDLEEAKQDLVNLGLTASVNDISFSSFELGTFNIPRWSTEPQTGKINSSSAEFTFEADDEGVACGICTTEQQTENTSSNILVGLTQYNELADSWKCQDAETGNVVLEELNPLTSYACYLVLCSEYPLWPKCDYSRAFNITTANAISNISNSSWLGLTICIFLLSLF